MNQRLKSLFIGAYPVLGLIGLYVSVDQFRHDNLYAAIGLVMTCLPIVFFLVSLFLTHIVRTDPNLKFHSFIVATGFLVLAYAFITSKAESIASIGFLSAFCWLLYLKWYSIFDDRANNKLGLGQMLPKMNFKDSEGNHFTSEDLLGKKNILMFYRGNWCPLCTAQVKELTKEYKELKSMNVQTLLISPQSQKKTQNLAKRFDVDFKFIVDENNTIARQLDIIAENGLPTGLQVLGFDSDTVMPTIILTNESGEIIFSDLTSNYRVRPEPSEFIKYFKGV